MVDPKLGEKRVCAQCRTKFYDLRRNPAACPKCGYVVDPTADHMDSTADDLPPDDLPPVAGDGDETEPEEVVPGDDPLSDVPDDD